MGAPSFYSQGGFMADEHLLHQAFRWGGPVPRVGDPAMLLDSILSHVEVEQQKQLISHYLDSVVATLQVNMKFVEGIRSVMGSGKGRG
jgi:hypothetical protein